MSHFISTYRHDYTWPQMSRARQLSPPQITKSITCTCVLSRKALGELLQMCEQPDDCSCTSRMERPLKLCFTKDKIKSKPPPAKYPDLCGKLRDEISARVNADRFKTTYQVDYSDPAAERMARGLIDKPSTTIVEEDSQQLRCCLPIKITIEPDFRPHYHSRLSSVGKSSRDKICDVPREKTTKYKKKKHDDDEGYFRVWKSEYQDTVGKIGHLIIKTKLHHSKTNVVPQTSSTLLPVKSI